MFWRQFKQSKKYLGSHLTSKLLVFTLLFIVLTSFAEDSYADTYHVSPSGIATWSNATEPGTPCSAATAMLNAQAGDIVYFRGGTYELGQSSGYTPMLNPSNSGTLGNPVTFQAYAGETPVMNCTVNADKDNSYAIGSNGRSYIIWDGFTIQSNSGVKMGSVIINGSSESNRVNGCQIKNCSINGGSREIPTDDNRDLIRINSSNDTLVENCRLFDAISSIDDDDICAIKMYHNDRVTIQNCEITNCSTGIFLKSDTDDSVIRYNYIENCNRSFHSTPALTVMQSDNVKIYHNVIANATFSGINVENDGSVYHGNNWEIYNNTLYNTTRGISFCANQAGNGWTIYNNIIQGCASKQLTGTVYGTLSACDHNQSGTSSLQIRLRLYQGDQGTYRSLSSWKSSGEIEDGNNPGTGSLASDPKFLNGSGNLNDLADFELASDSPCKGAGRNGVDMGADIDLVGIQGSSSPPPPPPVPNVTNVRLLQVTSPTTSGAYTTNISLIDLSGITSGFSQLTSISWTNSRGGAGNGAVIGSSSWSVSGISLAEGENEIEISVIDTDGLEGSCSITVTYSP